MGFVAQHSLIVLLPIMSIIYLGKTGVSLIHCVDNTTFVEFLELH